jgi:plasmid stability protein
MEKEKVTTRLDGPLRQRLRVYAAVTGRTHEDVVSAALASYLPPAPAEAATSSPDLVRTLANTNAAPAR